MSAGDPAPGRLPLVTAERRAVDRVEVLGALSAEVLIAQPLEITQMSAAGLEVLSRFPLLLDSLHEFRFTLGAQVVVVKGRITHCSVIDIDQERVEYRSGVDFTDIPRPIAEMIAEYAATLLRLRSDKGSQPGV